MMRQNLPATLLYFVMVMMIRYFQRFDTFVEMFNYDCCVLNSSKVSNG